MSIENEKKFLISTPKLPEDCKSYYVMSTYLTPPDADVEKRIRSVMDVNNKSDVKYYYTEKSKIGHGLQAREENEKEISSKEYHDLFYKSNRYLDSLVKERSVIPLNNGLKAEIDTYITDTGIPELNSGFSVLEIEIPPGFHGEIEFPKGIDIIKDVTENPEYKNRNLTVINSFEDGIIKPKDFFKNTSVIDEIVKVSKREWAYDYIVETKDKTNEPEVTSSTCKTGGFPLEKT